MANPYFNAAYYLRTNADVYAAGYTTETAEHHYLHYGAGEAYRAHPANQGGPQPVPPEVGSDEYLRKPAPWFDIKYYLDRYPDLTDNGVTIATAFQHFADYGLHEGRSPSKHIDLTHEALSAYAIGNPDLVTAFAIDDPYALTSEQKTALAQHFYQFGYQEDRPNLPAMVANLFTHNRIDPDATDPFHRFDTLEGTQYNDTFFATTENSLQTGDQLDGKGGYDVLTIAAGAISNAYPGLSGAPTIKNIEKIINRDVQSDDAAGKYLNLQNMAGVRLIDTDFVEIGPRSATGGHGYGAYLNAKAGTVFGVSNVAPLYKGDGMVGTFTVFADNEPGDTLDLRLDGNAPGSLYYAHVVNAFDLDMDLDDDSIYNLDLKYVNIDAVSQNSGTLVLNPLIQSIGITGDGDLALQNQHYHHLVSIDASLATGNMALGGANRDLRGNEDSLTLELGQNFGITTGGGNDIIDLSTVWTTGYVDAGDGDDTLIVRLYIPYEIGDLFDGDPPLASTWTLTGGDGRDTFTVGGNNWSLGSTTSHVVITDFNGAQDTLELGFGRGPAVFVSDATINRVVNNAQSADDVFWKLWVEEGAFENANVAHFEYGDNTYVVYGNDVESSTMVELTGVNLGVSEINIASFEADFM